MNRLAVGAALGGLAVYLYDPELGGERRGRLSSVWRENRDSALQAGLAASQTIESARPLARRMTKAVGRGDWAQAFDRGRPAASLPKLIGAAAVGGAFVYFMDPVKGSERRQSMLEAGRQAVRQISKAVKPRPGRVSDQVADTVEGVRSRVS
jgi:gas vesicle protein